MTATAGTRINHDSNREQVNLLSPWLALQNTPSSPRIGRRFRLSSIDHDPSLLPLMRLDRVSVLVRQPTLSSLLWIIGLGHSYQPNYLIQVQPIFNRGAPSPTPPFPWNPRSQFSSLCGILADLSNHIPLLKAGHHTITLPFAM